MSKENDENASESGSLYPYHDILFEFLDTMAPHPGKMVALCACLLSQLVYFLYLITRPVILMQILSELNLDFC